MKADIIGNITENMRENYAEKWDSAEELLGRDAFQELFTHIRMINRKTKSKDTILKEIRQYIKPKEDPEGFIDNILIPYSNAFYIIKNSKYEEICKTRYNTGYIKEGKRISEINSLLGWLNRIDNRDWVPPAILYFSKKWNKLDNLITFYRNLERLASGMMIQRLNESKRIERYSRLLTEIENDSDLNVSESSLQLIKEEKRNVLKMLNDEDFYSIKKVPKYVLLRLDAAMSDGTATYDYPIITVEHVLPQTVALDSVWSKWFPTQKEQKKYSNKLGNLVLLSRKKNSSANNYDFEKKKKNYFSSNNGGTSPFPLTTNVLERNIWNPQAIEERQNEMMKKVKEIWNL